MKIVSFCVSRETEDEYMRGFSELSRRPDFYGTAYKDQNYTRMQACRLKPKFIEQIFHEHAPFLYVDSDTLVIDRPIIPQGVDVGVCLNPALAEKGPPYNKKWIFSASCFYLSRSLAAAKFVARWNGFMRNKCGDHYPFMQSIKGATDITKVLEGKIQGFHRNKYFPILYREDQAAAGARWL